MTAPKRTTGEKNELASLCQHIEDSVPKEVLIKVFVQACMIADLPEPNVCKIMHGLLTIAFKQDIAVKLLLALEECQKAHGPSVPSAEQKAKAEAAMKEFIEKISTTSKGDGK